MPTLLDVIGIEPPESIAGVRAAAVRRRELRRTRSPTAPRRAATTTQYYEMLGCRAIYHDGWKAVTLPPDDAGAYDGTDPRRPFDEDPWELYHVAEDFAETIDLAAKEPDRLAEMIELWWSEAERNQVLPLTNQPGRHGDRRYRREHYEYYAGISSLPDAVAPNLRNRSWQMTAEIDNTDGDAAGVIANHGGAAGGYALYVKDGRLCYVDNFLGTETTIVRADVELPRSRARPCGARSSRPERSAAAGRRAVPRRRARRAAARAAHRADLVRHVGLRGRLPARPVDHAGLRRAVPVHAERLGKVTFDVEGRAPRDAAAQARVGNAIQ